MAPIKGTARELQVSRNTVKAFLKAEGILPFVRPNPNQQVAQNQEATPPKRFIRTGQEQLPEQQRQLSANAEFSFLDNMFENTKGEKYATAYGKHVKKVSKELKDYFQIDNPADCIRLEMAIVHYITYFRFTMQSLDVAHKEYVGPYSKYHEKAARAGLDWTTMAHKAFELFLKVIKELEVKYGKRFPDLQKANFHLNQQQINIQN